MSYDDTCKYLAENYPADILSWLLGIETQNIQVLRTELSTEAIRADSVTFLQTEGRVVHLEFQTRPYSSTPIPLRMLDYYVRLKRQYNCQIEQIVIFLEFTSSEAVLINQFTDTNISYRYRVVRIWEEDPTPLLNNPALLPFATLARSESPAELLGQIAQSVARIKEQEEQKNLSSCVQIMAGLRFEKDLIRQLFSGEAMRGSIIYQEILQQGRQEGLQQGRQEGRLEGLRQGLQQGRLEGRQEGQLEGQLEGQKKQTELLVIRWLNHRFGLLSPKLRERIQKLSFVQLEVLSEISLDFQALTDLTAWLDQQEEEANRQ